MLTTNQIKKETGVSLRQLQYWREQNIITPSINIGHGKGNKALYDFKDLKLILILKHLLISGISFNHSIQIIKYIKNQKNFDFLYIVYSCSDNFLKDLILIRDNQTLIEILKKRK